MVFLSDDLIGQQRVKEILNSIIERDRISHAYLFSGPKGSGMLPFALRFAECINNPKNTPNIELSWQKHPDIHVFIPMPSSAESQERNERACPLNATGQAQRVIPMSEICGRFHPVWRWS